MSAKFRYLAAAIAISLVAIFTIAASGEELFSPGKIDNGHKNIESKCDSCHTPFSGTMSSKCLACHRNVERQERRHRGTHGGVTGDCDSCHKLHQSGGEALRFNMESFNHALTAFGIDGHKNKSCADCHNQKLGAVPTGVCTDCHKSLAASGRFKNHLTAMGADCLSCHDGRSKGKYTHKASPAFFSGRHDGVKCGRCHESDYKAVTAACADCHRKKHTPLYGTDCAGCHQVSGWKVISYEHVSAKFGLDGHRRQRCTECHSRAFGQVPAAECLKCHRRLVNKEAFNNHIEALGRECLACHDGRSKGRYAHADPGLFSGKHASSGCRRCHKQGYKKLSAACGDCHRAKHEISFGSNCRKCHSFESWGRIIFDHGRTGFSLTAHNRQSCGTCHERKIGTSSTKSCLDCHRRIAKSGRFSNHLEALGTRCLSCHNGRSTAKFSHSSNPGFFAGKHSATPCGRCHRDSYKGVSAVCKSCHQRSHDPAYGSDCQRCHRLNGWGGVTFSHQPKLTGRHAIIACGSCHRGTSLAGQSAACARCHGVRHGAANADCARCHTTGGWRQLLFDHQRAACANCHAAPASHYGGACGSCHSTSGWKNASKHTPGAICGQCHQAKHKGATDCQRCHTTGSWAQLTFSHSSGNCSACHAAPANHYGSSCGSCHSTSGWRGAVFNHPRIGEHSYKSFPCATCHPGGYASSTCQPCHGSNNPKDDD